MVLQVRPVLTRPKVNRSYNRGCKLKLALVPRSAAGAGVPAADCRAV